MERLRSSPLTRRLRRIDFGEGAGSEADDDAGDDQGKDRDGELSRRDAGQLNPLQDQVGEGGADGVHHESLG